MSGRLFTSESVTEGHPDKIADQIAAEHPGMITVLAPIVRQKKGTYQQLLKDLNKEGFTRVRVNEQLRYGGVLEAVRVARSGYPVRLPHGEFFSRIKPCSSMIEVKGLIDPAYLVEIEATAIIAQD